MKEKPDFSNFLLNNIIFIRKYFIFRRKETNKMYKEVNSQRNRKIFLFLLCLCPIINTILFIYLYKLNKWINWYQNLDIIYSLIIYIIFVLRYIKIEFIEIEKKEQAKNTRTRLLEIFLMMFFIFLLFFSRGYIYMVLSLDLL